MRLTAAVAACVLVTLGSTTAFSHSGGTNAAGCHTNHRTGDFHCHTPKPRVPGRTAAPMGEEVPGGRAAVGEASLLQSRELEAAGEKEGRCGKGGRLESEGHGNTHA